MKQLFLIAIFIIYAFELSAQISTTGVTEISNDIENAAYDSTINFLGNNVHQYIGQVLYLKGKSESLRQYGYDGFVLNFNKSTISSRNVYKCCDSHYSKYSELAGRYFEVIDVHEHPQASENRSKYGSTYFLELREQESGDKVYFDYRAEYKHSFPFITVGYFEKLKSTNLVNRYVIRGRNWHGDDSPMTDIHTGNPVNFEPGSVWEIVDLTIEERFYSMVFLIQNNRSETIPIRPFLISDRNVFKYEDAKLYETKFGQEDWQTILTGNVKIGFTEEMAKLAWGEPSQINRSSRGSDQWVYDGQYLYFENGKLVAWN
ncbi:MAG: hypothetical protein WD607_06485 [Candidatus Paceibacterota bacterium]